MDFRYVILSTLYDFEIDRNLRNSLKSTKSTNVIFMSCLF